MLLTAVFVLVVLSTVGECTRPTRGPPRTRRGCLQDNTFVAFGQTYRRFDRGGSTQACTCVEGPHPGMADGPPYHWECVRLCNVSLPQEDGIKELYRERCMIEESPDNCVVSIGCDNTCHHSANSNVVYQRSSTWEEQRGPGIFFNCLCADALSDWTRREPDYGDQAPGLPRIPPTARCFRRGACDRPLPEEDFIKRMYRRRCRTREDPPNCVTSMRCRDNCFSRHHFDFYQRGDTWTEERSPGYIFKCSCVDALSDWTGRKPDYDDQAPGLPRIPPKASCFGIRGGCVIPGTNFYGRFGVAYLRSDGNGQRELCACREGPDQSNPHGHFVCRPYG